MRTDGNRGRWAAGIVAAAALFWPVLLPAVFGSAFRPSVRPFLWLLPGAIGWTSMTIFTNQGGTNSSAVVTPAQIRVVIARRR